MAAGNFYLPYNPIFNANGIPVAKGLVTFYAAGTTTKVTIYADAGMTTALPNPVQANGAGRLPAIYLADALYHVRITDEDGTVFQDIDPYRPGDYPAGPMGPAGPANSTYATLNTLAVAPVSNGSATLSDPTLGGLFLWKTGDFSAQAAIDTHRAIYVPSTLVSVTAGCWVRQYNGPALAAWSGVSGTATATYNVEALNQLVRLTSSVQLPGVAFNLNAFVNIPSGVRVFGSAGTVVTTTGDGGFKLMGSYASVSDMAIVCGFSETFGPIQIIDAPFLRGARIERLRFTWAAGILCNAMTIVSSNGLDGVIVLDIYAYGYPRMVTEYLGDAPSTNFHAENIVGEAPTGAWAAIVYGTSAFTPVLSIDSADKLSTVERCVAIGSLGTAFERIRGDNTRYSAMLTQRCANSILASTGATTTNLTVDGWKDISPASITTFTVNSTYGAEYRNLEGDNTKFYSGPADNVRLVNCSFKITTLTPTNNLFVVWSGGGAGGGRNFEMQGGVIDVSAADVPAAGSLVCVLLDARPGQQIRGVRFIRRDTTQGFIGGSGAANALMPGCTYQTGDTQSLTAS